jgi:Zn-dependent peptidase ImmA (M78 family)
MNFKISSIAILVALSASTSVMAQTYSCKVYCANGSTFVNIKASSAKDAAEKIDPTPVANQICREAGKGNASSNTMGSNQCTRN